jgi:tetratricopeptide (TPR) repeat protein
MKPICFMIMPFRIKDTGAAPPAPARVNFDALWEKALLPTIEELGFEPVRADQDIGGLIIKDMIERLYFSDLVVADLTIANGNVYYEVGVRHAAKNVGCVLISADWSKQLFDLNQIRQARYPLPAGELTDTAADAIRQALVASVPKLAEGTTPIYQTLPGFPNEVVPDRASVIRDYLDEISAFQADTRAVRHAPTAQQHDRALALRDRFPGPDMRLPGIAYEIVQLLRDYAGWEAELNYIDVLPKAIRQLPVMHEQRCLALSNTGDHAAAIGALEELVRTTGDSSERQGLIGGRYKRLYRAAVCEADRRRYLNKAIEHYERGMMLDLNDYYPSCNLPALYRDRGGRGDLDRMRITATVARMACDRAIQRKADDHWTRPTLLGLACVEGDVQVLEELCDQIEAEAEGHVRWKVGTTVDDLRWTADRTSDPERQKELQKALVRLQRMLPSPAAS